MSNKPFITLEDEIMFRKGVRNVYKHEGAEGVLRAAGELNTCLKITLETLKDILDEEDAKGTSGSVL